MSSRSRAAVAADLATAPGASAAARSGVLLAAVAVGVGTTLALRAGEAADSTAAATAAEILGMAIGWSFVASGLVAWTRRPGNRTGPLMVLVGFLWFIGRLDFAADPSLETLGGWVRPLHIAVFAHVLLAFPSGRLESRLAMALAAAAYANVGIVNNAPNVLGDTPLAAVLFDASQLGTAAIFLAIIGALVHRWHTGTPAWRRTVAPLLWPGALALSTLILFFANEVFGQPLGTTPGWLFRLAYLTLPLLFLAGLLRTRLARASVAELVIELGEREPTATLRDALARALGDPTLQLAYWLADEQRYVDLDGRSIELPAPEERRTATIVERDGARVAALLHDEALADDRDLLRAVSATAALALENERLQAELRARLEDLRASRARVVHAADEERKRIERILHDGTQQRLTSIALGLGMAESTLPRSPAAALEHLRRSKETLMAALAELRDLSQGIHPGTLTEQGLAAALDDLAYALPIPVTVTAELKERLPEDVEAAAYFLVAEALTNIAKHASAGEASVTVAKDQACLLIWVRDDGAGGADPRDGSGLRGLADRIGALGGHVTVDSPPGRGTTIRAEIPCA